MTKKIKVGLGQMAPIWLHREKTLEKMCGFIELAGGEKCDLIVFGEAILPGYPFWIEWTDGARFESQMQKEIHAHYLDQAVRIEKDHLKPICQLAKKKGVAVLFGCMEAAADRGGHSLYCTLVYIDKSGAIQNTHRKLMPTYEERLSWAPGDGHGLRVFPLGPFNLGGLNCWENWMPLARSALYAQGEDLHVAIWPGSVRNTDEITRFIAKESRSFVISVSGLLSKSDIQGDIPHIEKILNNCPAVPANGGSCICGPDGKWIIEPVVGEERFIVAELDSNKIGEERQNFDPAGHYGRPDVTRLLVNRKRQKTGTFFD